MKNKEKSIYYYFGLLGQIGFTVIFSILFFVIIHRVLFAKYISENPIFFILFIFMGVAGGFISVWKMIMKG